MAKQATMCLARLSVYQMSSLCMQEVGDMARAGSINARKIGAICLLLVFLAASFLVYAIWTLPRGVHFAAPHQNPMGALEARLQFNQKPVARFVGGIMQRMIPPTVYAGCSKPPCNSESSFLDGHCCAPLSPNGTCPCNEVGCGVGAANKFCEELGPRTCFVTNVGQFQCNTAQNKRCQVSP
jgi:hypothetical protein